jgi:hypothetical protein
VAPSWRSPARPTPKWATESGSFAVEADVALSIGEWHHVAGVFDGAEGRIYVDGEVAGSGPSTGAGTGVTVMRFGQISRGGSGNGSCPCAIDEVRIFARTLTPEEVTAEYLR